VWQVLAGIENIEANLTWMADENAQISKKV
jgi:hypothetical protein